MASYCGDLVSSVNWMRKKDILTDFVISNNEIEYKVKYHYVIYIICNFEYA